MLNTIRSISTESHFASAPRMQKAMRVAGQIVFVLYLALFVSDTINIDEKGTKSKKLIDRFLFDRMQAH